ncbi:MAG TPA: hypothetical protein VHA77_16050 [Xanthobacteraceae bacterium]|nr:hypothetical protein [Xanthobacteraceae bacterium]
MKLALGAAFLAAAISTPAFADPPINVDGVYRCVHLCRPGYEGLRAFIGQSGTDVNLVSEAGNAATGYIEYPSRIWVDKWDQGAMISPDGTKIQFDNGTVWVREVPVIRGVARRVYR